MTHADMIHLLDQKYSGEGAIQCPNEGVSVKLQNGLVRSNHGALGVHNSGAYLVCGLCGHNQPTSSIQ